MCLQGFRLQAIAMPLSATGEVNSTPHRAHLTRATHVIFLVCTWLKVFELCCSLVFLESHSISSMFRGTLLETLFSTFSTPFPTLAKSPTTTLSLLQTSASASIATLQGGLCFGQLAEQSPLIGKKPKCLIEVSSEHTPIVLPST